MKLTLEIVGAVLFVILGMGLLYYLVKKNCFKWGDGMGFVEVFVQTFLAFFAILIYTRILSKRQIGQLTF